MSGIIGGAGSKSGVFGPKTFADTPSFFCHSAAGQTNGGANTFTTITFGTEEFDNGGDMSSTTFTAPVDGRYSLSAVIRYGSIPTDALYIECVITITGGPSNRQFFDNERANTQSDRYVSVGGTTLVDLDAGDTAYVRSYSDGGSGLQCMSGNATYFCGHLVR